MDRRAWLTLAFALALTCAPTAIPRSQGEAPSASLGPIATTDVITLREGGQQPAFVVRSVATSDAVRTLPDGVLLPDGTTIFTVETGPTTRLSVVDRRTGAIASRTIAGSWDGPRTGPYFAGLSPNGVMAVLRGGSYNFTDAGGTWTAKTTFAVVDTLFKLPQPRVLELDGRYTFEAISNDGRWLYLGEAVPVQQPTRARLRAYDLRAGELSDLSGDAVPDLLDIHTPVANIGGVSLSLFAGRELALVRLDLDGHAARVLRLPAAQAQAQGAAALMWSLVGTRYGRTVYAVNPAIGVIDEIDVPSMELLRTAPLNETKTERPGDALMAALHPIAYAKRGLGTGAVLSPQGTTIYALGEAGVWSIDTASLRARQLTRDGTFESIALSPDGMRLYVLGFDDGIVRALDYLTGRSLGAMKRIAFPSAIIAVDAGG